MLRKIRIALAALSFIGITLLFAGIGRDWWGWMPKLQMLPATMRLIGGFTLGNAAVVLGILLVTLLVGRLYCSVVCPLGVFQDVVIWLRRAVARIQETFYKLRLKKMREQGKTPLPRLKPVRKKFKFNKERPVVRYGIALLTIAAIFVDLQMLVALIGPYSAYGRMVRSIIGGGPAPLLIAAAVTFVVIVLCAWIWGRAWCNNVCPVGSVLGAVSRFQIFGVKVDKDKCINCGACSKGCKGSCIEEGSLAIDYSRCVDCFDCIGNCKQGAISFGKISRGTEEAPATSTPDSGRRAFIATGALLAGSAVTASAQKMKLDGGLADIEAKTALKRTPLLVPPGAGSVKNFYDSCTACQLCVSSCPNGVLRPSTDFEHFLQPQMGYEKGFCRPECTACSEVCPAGAIRKIEAGEKAAIHIGVAEVNAFVCLAATGEESCGNCARHCPTGAIMMVPVGESGSRRPVVAEEQCIGCGKCEYLCPVRPVSAITVKGRETHITD